MSKESVIRSMTGFGRGQARGEKLACYVEIKSVNHRYLEINTRIPDELSFFDLEIKKLVKYYVKRGAVYLSLNLVYEGGIDLEIDDELFKKILKLEKEIERRHGILQPLNIHYILSYPGVVREIHAKVPFKEKRELIQTAVKNALTNLILSREREGWNLKKDIEEHLIRIEKDLLVISRLEEEREKFLLKSMQEQIPKEEGFQAQSVTTLASTAEEIVRLKSHLRATRSLLTKAGVIGRELDFFAQEMAREINTLSAKALSAKTSKFVVKIKVEIEKIREQALNIE